MIPKMGHPQPRLGFEIGHRQTAVGRPRFPEVLGKSWAIRMSPKMALSHTVAHKNRPNLGTKQARGEMAGNYPENGASPSEIRVRNMVSSKGGRLSTISQNFMKIMGNSSVSENDPSRKLTAIKNWPNVGTKTGPRGEG